MSRKKTTQAQGFVGTIKKFFLSAFVVVTFMAYLMHERLTNAASASPANTAANTGSVPSVPDPNSYTVPTVAGQFPATIPTMAVQNPGAVSTQTVASQAGLYKNGSYTGPSVDVFYGLVQVQVVIQNGQIANVTFLDYPHDRRTSQEINTQAMPMLTQEAIQAQSANVNIISGATLTSEGFANSLQAALLSATN